MTETEKGGVILLKYTDRKEILVADIYNDETSRWRLWAEWAGAALEMFRQDKEKHAGLLLLDYRTDSTKCFRNCSDERIGRMMDCLIPHHCISVCQLFLGMRKCPGPLAPDKLRQFVRRNADSRLAFNPSCRKRRCQDGVEKDSDPERCHLQRVLETKGRVSFLGGDDIRGSEDVAWLARQAGAVTPGQRFAMLRRGGRGVLLWTGIGRTEADGAEQASLTELAARYDADRVEVMLPECGGMQAGGTSLGALLVDDRMAAVANLLLPCDLQSVVRVLYEIRLQQGGRRLKLFLYTCTEGEEALGELYAGIRRQLGRAVEIQDIVTGREGEPWRSFAEEGILRRDRDGGGFVWSSVEVITIKDGRSVIRVGVGGSYLPAKFVRRSDITRLLKGDVTKEELAVEYFSGDGAGPQQPEKLRQEPCNSIDN